MKKQALFRKEIIIKLIRDHLINTKLVSGLNALGLNADEYALYLGDTIFLLMGLKGNEHNDLIFEKIFLANSEKVKHINFAYDMEELNALSKLIYEELVLVQGITRSGSGTE
jgi:hypothetical protein